MAQFGEPPKNLPGGLPWLRRTVDENRQNFPTLAMDQGTVFFPGAVELAIGFSTLVVNLEKLGYNMI